MILCVDSKSYFRLKKTKKIYFDEEIMKCFGNMLRVKYLGHSNQSKMKYIYILLFPHIFLKCYVMKIVCITINCYEESLIISLFIGIYNIKQLL